MSVLPWRDRYVFSFEHGQITPIKYSCIICWDGDAEERFHVSLDTQDKTAWAAMKSYILADTEEKAAGWLEWAPKWQKPADPNPAIITPHKPAHRRPL